MSVLKISVYMTVKNGQKFITRALNSVFYQTVLPKEIVVVDDGSTDDTVSLIKELSNTTVVPIKLIETGGIGRAQALNLAVDNCSYEWVANLDVDDFWLPRKFESQVKLIESTPKAKVVVTSSVILFENEKLDSLQDNLFDYSFSKLTKVDFYARNPINHSSILINKDIFYIAGRYNNNLNKQIDYELWIRLILKVGVIYQVDNALAVKYLHSKQSFESKNVFSYKLNALNMKFFMLKKLDAPLYFYTKPLVFFIFGFLPRKVKRLLRSIWGGR